MPAICSMYIQKISESQGTCPCGYAVMSAVMRAKEPVPVVRYLIFIQDGGRI